MKKRLQIILGTVITVVLVWFLFRDTDWAEVWHALRQASVPWILLSLVFVFAAFFLRAQRWSYIVRTAGPVSYGVLFDATQIGFLANFVLPARAGEAVRAVVLAKLTGFPITKSLAFGALDRVTDLIALFAVLAITVVVYRPDSAVVLPPGFDLPDWASALLEPAAIRNAALMASLGIVALVAVMVVLYVNTAIVLRMVRATLGRFAPRWAEKLNHLIQHFADGLHVLKSPSAMAGAIAFSLLTWLVSALAIWAGLVAFHIDGPWYTSLLVLAMTAIAISAPSTPGFVGAFHLGIMLGLFFAIAGLSADTAKAYAIFGHLSNVLPVYLVGFISLWRRQIGLLQLKSEAEQVEEETGEVPAEAGR
jgi:uncharacterized protein (TIRG00374 family)